MKTETEKLTAYIRDVICNSETAILDISALSNEYKELGEMLKKVQHILQHMNQQAECIVRGDCLLENEIPKGIPSTFMDMIREMRRRTTALENERNLFVQFTETAAERIVVLDEETGEFLFGNKSARKFYEEHAAHMDSAADLNAQSRCSAEMPYSQWLHVVNIPGDEDKALKEYYQVNSIYIMWESRGAIAHMFSDETEKRRAQDLAMRDQMTGTYNRRYAMNYMKELEENGQPFAIGFIDVDYLKYCNDVFGHNAGDLYLGQVVHILQQLGEARTLCRTGGDEFLVISPLESEGSLRSELETLRGVLMKEKFSSEESICKSFSYGVAAASSGRSFQDALADADERMYQNKLENKKKNHIEIKDERLR